MFVFQTPPIAYYKNSCQILKSIRWERCNLGKGEKYRGVYF
jgi:hypothetical protein